MISPTEIIIKIAGTPNASGKQDSCPKHLTSLRRLGVKMVEIKEPALIAK